MQGPVRGLAGPDGLADPDRPRPQPTPWQDPDVAWKPRTIALTFAKAAGAGLREDAEDVAQEATFDGREPLELEYVPLGKGTNVFVRLRATDYGGHFDSIDSSGTLFMAYLLPAISAGLFKDGRSADAPHHTRARCSAGLTGQVNRRWTFRRCYSRAC